jgi:hypothetical protein
LEEVRLFLKAKTPGKFRHAYWRDSLDAVENAAGFASEQAAFYILCAISFLVPFSIGEPQLVVGTIVNSALVAGAYKLRGWTLLPLVILPSLGALSRGLIFGPFTPFLVFMLPFIWVGNAALVLAVKRLNVFEKRNYAIGASAGIALKVAFLFASAYALYSLKLVPSVFLTTMGSFQLVTALAGAAVAFAALKLEKRLTTTNPA